MFKYINVRVHILKKHNSWAEVLQLCNFCIIIVEEYNKNKETL